MNAPFSPPAADGVVRRSFAVADILAMIEHGIIGQDENIELLDGEIVTVAPESSRHGRIKNKLSRFWHRNVADDLIVLTDTTLYLDARNFVEPDIYIVVDSVDALHTPGPDVLLLVEVALSSQAFDSGIKAGLYARHGLREYWVVDGESLITRVFRQPVDGRYTQITEIAMDQPLEALALPGLSLALEALNLD